MCDVSFADPGGTEASRCLRDGEVAFDSVAQRAAERADSNADRTRERLPRCAQTRSQQGDLTLSAFSMLLARSRNSL